MDLRTRKVTVHGREVALTPKEFDILECLASDPGRVMTRQEILESAWDAHWYGPTKVLDVHVAALRRKLDVPGPDRDGLRQGLPARRGLMARRIVLTMLALIGALLVTTVVPLGLITTGHERSSFRQDTILSARALAGVAEDRLADRPPAGAAAVARALAQARRAGDQVAVYDAGRRLVIGTAAADAAIPAATLTAALHGRTVVDSRSMTGCG